MVVITLLVVGFPVMMVVVALLRRLVAIWVVLLRRRLEVVLMGVLLLNLLRILSNATKRAEIPVTILEYTSQICH